MGVSVADGGSGGLPFRKGHGTGNDFVLLPDPDGRLELTPDLVRRLCHRRFGIGGDGVLRIVRTAASGAVRSSDGVDGDTTWFMDYHNADGSVAEMCGNGVRVYARFLVDAGWEPAGEMVLATRGGPKRVHVPAAGDVTVDMGPPEVFPDPVRAEHAGTVHEGVHISMGNPHLVIALASPAEVAALDLTRMPIVAPEEFPDGVNVEFYAVAADGTREMRVHERGVGETLSCGTGACAVAVAAGDPGRSARVRVPGGVLQVEWTSETVLLTGPAELVAEGRWSG